jgi:hypothetical protein
MRLLRWGARSYAVYTLRLPMRALTLRAHIHEASVSRVGSEPAAADWVDWGCLEQAWTEVEAEASRKQAWVEVGAEGSKV